MCAFFSDFVHLAKGTKNSPKIVQLKTVDLDVMVLRFNVHQGIAHNTTHDPRAPTRSGYGAAYVDDQRVKIHEWLDPYFCRA